MDGIVSGGRVKKSAKKAHPKDPFWSEKTKLVKRLLRDVGLTQDDLRDKLLTFNSARTPTYKINFDHFRRVMQGNERRPPHFRDFLNDIGEILTAQHQPSEQAKKRDEYLSLFFRMDKIAAASGASHEDDKTQHFGMEREREVDRNEYLKNVYAWYREHRPTLARIARAYYAKVPEVVDLPMVTRSEWLPKHPIPLNKFDLQLSWVEDERDPPPPLLEALDKETYSRFLERIAPDVQQEDRFCYRLLEVSPADDTIKLVFSPSRYRRFINSCEALGYELAEWFYRNQKDLDIKRAPTNDAFLTGRGDPRAIFNLRMHSGCPGISTLLLIWKASQGDFFYLHKRSGPVLDSPGGLHVVPAGQFQPDTDEDINHDRDFSMQRTVMREFGEELLGIEKFKDVMRTSENFYDHPRLEPFVRGLREGFVRGYFLGLGFDPLPTKPGLLTALVIDASRLPPGALEFTDNWEGKSLEVPLSQLEKWSKDERLIPDGATCLQLVQRHLKFLLGK